MRKAGLGLVGLALLAAGGLAGYGVGKASSSTARPGGREDASPVVARFAGGVIRADAVRARMEAEGPLAASAYATPAGQRELVQRMAREQVLLTHARSKGYHQRPAVVAQCERTLLEAYLEGEFEAPERTRPLTDADVDAAMEAQRSALARPEQVRVAHVFLAAPEGDATRREKQRRAAAGLQAQVRAAFAKGGDEAVAALARKHSEDPRTRPLGGELPPASREQLARVLGPEGAEAVMAYPGSRGVLERVLETKDGFHVVVLLERRAAMEPSRDQVRQMLEPRLLRERRAKAYDTFVSGLERAAGVQIDEEALSHLRTATKPNP